MFLNYLNSVPNSMTLIKLIKHSPIISLKAPCYSGLSFNLAFNNKQTLLATNNYDVMMKIHVVGCRNETKTCCKANSYQGNQRNPYDTPYPTNPVKTHSKTTPKTLSKKTTPKTPKIYSWRFKKLILGWLPCIWLVLLVCMSLSYQELNLVFDNFIVSTLQKH